MSSNLYFRNILANILPPDKLDQIMSGQWRGVDGQDIPKPPPIDHGPPQSILEVLTGRGVPLREATDATSEKFRKTKAWVQARRWLDQLPATVGAPGWETTRTALFFCGPTGTGKSVAAAMALSKQPVGGSVPPRHSATSILEWIPIWITADDFVAATFDRDSERSMMKVARARHSSFLVLDELGDEWAGREGYSPALVARLLCGRLRDGLPTIVTSNSSPDALVARYRDRLEDRMAQTAIVVSLDGEPSMR
jgi:DNA replication protein DnaC